MWYKETYNDPTIHEWTKKIQDANQIVDPEEKSDALNDLLVEYFNTFGVGNKEYYDIIYIPLHRAHSDALGPAIEASKIRRQKEREQTGEPELSLSEIETYPEWIAWKERTYGTLSEYDLPYLISGIDKYYNIYKNSIWKTPSFYGDRGKQIVDPDEVEYIKSIYNDLQNRSFEVLGIDKNKLSDKELWKIISVGEFDKTLELVKQISWLPNNDPDAEGAIITFVISPNGISVFAEVADPIPIQVQKQELNKFMNDVDNYIPPEWSKEIKYIEGGDFEAILSGKMDKKIKVYRMMSNIEYEKWLSGEVIPVGKYFALKREYASGTDFGNEGFRDIFTFFVDRMLMSGMDENVVVSSIPLKLEGQSLTAA